MERRGSLQIAGETAAERELSHCWQRTSSKIVYRFVRIFHPFHNLHKIRFGFCEILRDSPMPSENMKGNSILLTPVRLAITQFLRKLMRHANRPAERLSL